METTTELGHKLTRGPWRTIEQIKRANERIGHYWFSPGALRFFRSRVHDRIYAGRLFVSSEEPPSGGRRYGIKAAMDNGVIETVTPILEGYRTRGAAHRAAERMAAELE